MTNKPIRKLSLLFALLVLCVPEVPAEEDRHLVRSIHAGVLSHDIDDLWSGKRRESGIDLSAEVVFEPSARLFGQTIRPSLGASVNTSGDTSKVWADARLEWTPGRRWFIASGLGLAVHDGETETADPKKKSLGSRVLFHVPLEVGFRPGSRWSVSLYFDHVSNANLADPNQGMDTLGLRAGLWF